MTEPNGEARHSGHASAEAALEAIGRHLDGDQTFLSGIDPLLDRAGYSQHDVLAMFGTVDELLVALARHYADQLSAPLIRRDLNDVAIVRDSLVHFGIRARKEYAATLVGLVRLIIAEGARSKDLRDRIYAAGPGCVSSKLCAFLAAAKDAGVLDLLDASLATEQLMGVLREPLYQALLLHPMDEAAADREDAATAAVDLFLDGCTRRSS
ncbi:TetR/AcrR family transcriptional regulator C-terminal domain-containing protein [Roseixanthobacter glucoisosaccharinicivorans]|uniref:TetR/AcrR family transcriptional regulator C-terminal domain-containing protein n=1 Tax=Roseixanthobacter glucoisosaccharinicivorans TaxID=3119923 RepID=UPI0037299E4D